MLFRSARRDNAADLDHRIGRKQCRSLLANQREHLLAATERRFDNDKLDGLRRYYHNQRHKQNHHDQQRRRQAQLPTHRTCTMKSMRLHTPRNFRCVTTRAFVATRYRSASAQSSPPTPSSSASTFKTSSGRFGSCCNVGNVSTSRPQRL